MWMERFGDGAQEWGTVGHGLGRMGDATRVQSFKVFLISLLNGFYLIDSSFIRSFFVVFFFQSVLSVHLHGHYHNGKVTQSFIALSGHISILHNTAALYFEIPWCHIWQHNTQPAV